MARVTWSGTMDPRLRNAERKAQAYLSRTTAYYSLRIEGYARRAAKWTDRTGNARSGLTGIYEIGDNSYAVELFHRVNYGIWLEVRFGGRYAIIQRSIDNEGQKFLAAANKVIANMFGGS